ncbi:hypothetical protein [Streptomyces sp. NPDC057966]|uniref:hypothetical protein n=1 Tax=Streptomyces sp. NPDC057966 TaxID=3346292 RepID=UPI0036E6B66F
MKPSPAQAPGFRKVKADVTAKGVRLAHHAPAATESKSAQDAAVAPPDDKEAQGKAANAEKMNAAKPGEFNKQAFIDAVNKAIDAQAPKSLDDADKFSKSGKADKIKGEVDGKVKDGKESSAKDIDTATKAPPDTSGAKDKPVTPMSPDQAPGNPGAPAAADAVPAQQPASVTDFSEGPAANDQAMADAEVTEDQLAKGNEPEFDQALSAKKTAETDSAKAPAKGRAAEAQQLSTAKAGAAASGAKAMNALTATRSSAGKQVDGGKGETKSKDEKKRAEVTAKLQKVYDGTKKDVEETLSGLDKKVDDKFTSGEKAARDAFTADHKRRMKAYKDKRYSGWTGKARWVKDKFAGLPKEADSLYQEARKLYVAKMQTVISSVADIIGAELGRAKARIAKGRAELKAEVDRLPADLRQFGEDAAKDFAGKFDDLEATVNEKSEQLVQDLAQKYTAALNKVDEEIKKLQEANRGLIDKAKDAIVGAIKTINELKNLLLGILAKAASAIMKIIKDPIGFLGNLVKAVGAGLQLFVTNVAEHLKTGVVSWLLGTAVKAGLELPQRFDLKGIIQLIGSLLGLSWANIRARITRKGIPDQAMTAVESSVPVAKKLAAEGPAGAVKEIESEAGDLKATILEKLTSYLIPTVIIAGITWIISLLNPASAFVRAVKGIIDIVTFIVNQGAQIVEFVNAVLDAVIAIANGGSAGVPKMVEAALAASVPLLIGFLASLLGIGSLANKVKSVFHAVARPVNRAVDKIVGFIAKKGKALWNKLKGKNGKDGKGDEKKPGQDNSDGKKGNERQAIDESSRLLAKNPAKADAVSGISAIARRNKVPSLHLVTESRTDHTEKVHVQTMTTPSFQLGPAPPYVAHSLGQLITVFQNLSDDDLWRYALERNRFHPAENANDAMVRADRARKNLCSRHNLKRPLLDALLGVHDGLQARFNTLRGEEGLGGHTYEKHIKGKGYLAGFTISNGRTVTGAKAALAVRLIEGYPGERVPPRSSYFESLSEADGAISGWLHGNWLGAVRYTIAKGGDPAPNFPSGVGFALVLNSAVPDAGKKLPRWLGGTYRGPLYPGDQRAERPGLPPLTVAEGSSRVLVLIRSDPGFPQGWYIHTSYPNK